MIIERTLRSDVKTSDMDDKLRTAMEKLIEDRLKEALSRLCSAREETKDG